jgi:hypothetical protein
MAGPEIALAAAKPVTVSANWKLLAVLIGLAVLVVLYLVTWITSGQPNPWNLVQGADGAASTSKFQ